MFLAGLVHRMNSLMVEIKVSMEKEGQLNLQIEDLEDQEAASGKILRLRGLVTREREMRDELWAEWCAELATIRKSEAMQDHGGAASQMLMTGLELQELNAKIENTHQLALFHSVLQDANTILGATLEVPANLQERRDAILLEIAQNNELTNFFYRLPPERRKHALEQFGNLLLDHTGDADNIQRLIDRELVVTDLPALEAHVQELVTAETPKGITEDLAQINVEIRQ